VDFLPEEQLSLLCTKIPPTFKTPTEKKGSGVFFLDAFWSRRYLVRMPRRLRCATGGFVYHALNRAVGRATLFDQPGDYAAFLKVLREANDWLPMRLLAWCALPNHWHLVLWPQRDRDLSEYLRWLTVTHTQRWHAHHHTAGTGPLYQGRFKSFPTRRTTTCSASGAMSSAIRCALSWCPAPRIGAGRAWRSACRAAGPRC
jgi:REP element-mobilizing transposase RayT